MNTKPNNMKKKLLKQHRNKKYTFLNCTFWDIVKFSTVQQLTGNEPRQEIK